MTVVLVEIDQIDENQPGRNLFHRFEDLRHAVGIVLGTLYLTVLYTIASFEVFERIYIMVPSGVGNSTQTIVTQIYANGFKEFNFGVASAQAFVLFAIIAVFAIFQFRLLRSDEES